MRTKYLFLEYFCTFEASFFNNIMAKILAYLLFLTIMASSCQFIENWSSDNPKRIDFKSVDAYPVFPSCDSLATMEFQKKCFEDTVSKLIQAELDVNELTSPVPMSTAIIVHIQIDKNGKASLLKLENFNKIKPYLPELEDVIRQSLANFPVLKPAQKHHINVTSTYMVPIYIVD